MCVSCVALLKIPVNFKISRLGALELQAVRKRKEPQKRQKNDSTGAVTKPKEVLSFEEEEETTTRNVLHLLKCLKDTCADDGAVHFFKFLVDPQSFSHTVENMFYLSFLVKVRESVSRQCVALMPLKHEVPAQSYHCRGHENTSFKSCAL